MLVSPRFTHIFIYVFAHYSFLHLKLLIFVSVFSKSWLLAHSLSFFLKVFNFTLIIRRYLYGGAWVAQ